MISRENFMFTVGYQGNSAIVDGSSKRRYGNLDTEELMEKGLFKPALCAAIYSGDDEEIRLVLKSYNKHVDGHEVSLEDLKRILGVNMVPGDIDKVIVV
ncbi:MAG: hypothetical protein JW881_13415 [Spirochaetales bacterium]|nr:hypothetical protein [Spirochaetales bacterium]